VIADNAAALQVDVSLRRDTFALQCRFESDARAVAVFGPSGAGKSTVLALIAGLLRPDSGRIVIDGEVLVDMQRGVWLAPHQRRVGVVFQDSLLFPHLSVNNNLRYGMRGKPSDPDAEPRFNEVVGLLGIDHLLSRPPRSLSGGERQRVAIGRALLARPRMLLMDEPLASLDYARRQEIMPYLNRVREEFDMPLVYVSHALDEVVRVADDVVLMDRGRVVGQGAPDGLLMPVSADADGFGVVSVVEATIGRYDPEDEITELEHPAGRISLPGKIGQAGGRHRVLVRATDVAIAVARPREISHRTILRGRITECHVGSGPLVRLDIALVGHGRLAALLTRRSLNELAVDVGDEIFALAKSTAIDDRAFGHGPGA
jgi:molybdate transport system ATP-binding protein